MRSIYGGIALAATACLALWGADVFAQQVTVSTPFHSVNEGFFENMGTSWGLSGRNWNFSFGGGPLQAAPQFGGFDPSAGANFGLGWRSGGINGFFNGNWSQGSRRSFVSQVPSITLQNGVPGFLSDTSQSPFVVSYIPVVGGFSPVGAYSPVQPLPPNMLPSPGASGVGRDAVVNALAQARAERLREERIHDAPPAEAAGPVADEPAQKLAAARASSAGQPVPSVADARRLYAAEQAEEHGEALLYVERARNAEAKGKPNVAKVYYQMAAQRASGQLREQVLARLNALETWIHNSR